MSFIQADAANVKAAIADMMAQFPELADDETLRADMFEAEADLNRVIDKAIREKLDADTMAAAIKERVSDLSERKRRQERRAEAMKGLVKSLMLAADLPKVVLPDATVSITKPRTKVNVTDIDALPQGFFLTERKAKSAEIKTALEAGEQVPGAELVLGDDGLMVRTK